MVLRDGHARGILAVPLDDPVRNENDQGNVGENLGIHGALDAFGHLASAQGHTERAVKLAGAADRLRATGGTQSWPVVQRTRAQWLDSARQTLEKTTYQAAWEQGQTMNREEAIAYALSGKMG